MVMYVESLFVVTFWLTIVYFAMKTLSVSAGDDIVKKRFYFIIFFAICAFLYMGRTDAINKKNEKIQDYLYEIQNITDKIYSDLDGTNLIYKVEDELWDINQNIEEIYSLMND